MASAVRPMARDARSEQNRAFTASLPASQLTDLSDMYKLVLIRHGESTWNKENRFTGWVDVDLTEQGNREARQAACC